MLKIVFFVPEVALESVKAALFIEGAGCDEKYQQCCWQTVGEMQFVPVGNSDPAIGEKNELVVTKEYKVEMLCPKTKIKAVIAALKKVHPYERPAYEIYELQQEV